MAKGSSYARKQKRQQFRQAGFLKIKNMFGRFSEQGIAWYTKMAEDGKESERINEKRRLDSIEEQLMSKLNILKETWESFGYNSDEISKLEEAWTITAIKDKDTYRADKKQANVLRREAQQSLAARKNAGN
jgi:hypothetical protein